MPMRRARNGNVPPACGTMMRNFGGGVRLVDENDPGRVGWARTEFTVEIPSRPDQA